MKWYTFQFVHPRDPGLLLPFEAMGFTREKALENACRQFHNFCSAIRRHAIMAKIRRDLTLS